MRRKQYAEVDVKAEGLSNFNKLNDGHKKIMVEVATAYMRQLERVKCPTCPAGKRYMPINKLCVSCWYKVLDDTCEETIRTEGWNDAE